MRDLLLSLLVAPLPVQIAAALFLALCLVTGYFAVFYGLKPIRRWQARREMRRIVQRRLRVIK